MKNSKGENNNNNNNNNKNFWIIFIIFFEVSVSLYVQYKIQKLNSRNLIKGINTWAVPLIRYSGPFLTWTRDGLRQMDQRTRKLMTMHKALHLRDDVDRIYVPRKEGGRGLASIEHSVDTSIQRLEDYIEKHERGLITAIRNNTYHTIDNRMTITWKQKWEKNQLHGRFKRLIKKMSTQITWTWLRKGNFKRETDSLQMAGQSSVMRTNHIKARIDKTQQNSKCRLCGEKWNHQSHNKRMRPISTKWVQGDTRLGGQGDPLGRPDLIIINKKKKKKENLKNCRLCCPGRP